MAVRQSITVDCVTFQYQTDTGHRVISRGNGWWTDGEGLVDARRRERVRHSAQVDIESVDHGHQIDSRLM